MPPEVCSALNLHGDVPPGVHCHVRAVLVHPSYLRQRRVPLREADISRDTAAARDLVRRSGQTGYP
ncbi:MAG TPA: hypothetical protein VMV92_31155 [Streptosporangiaceae bacterium]|nr:hypothetical protein [Streptosporangiaceae bacterium]